METDGPLGGKEFGRSQKHGPLQRSTSVGAVAFSRTGDPATGDLSDAKLIRKFGDVPDDLL
jgi:hypothetical protein